jgi:hypothetical protein
MVFNATFNNISVISLLSSGPQRLSLNSPVIRIKILIMGHFLLTFRISMGHSFTFFVNISEQTKIPWSIWVQYMLH